MRRCSTCYTYLRRRGIDRPKRLIKKVEACQDCREGVAFAKGRCRTCYGYFLTNGKTRPSHLRRKSTMDCRNPNCRKPLRLCVRSFRGYCVTCYDYRRQNNGGDRPARHARLELEPGYRYCENPNCDKVLRASAYGVTRCRACLNWMREKWEERPQELCPHRVTLGWCECGKVARHVVSLWPGRRGELILCERCYELEESVNL